MKGKMIVGVYAYYCDVVKQIRFTASSKEHSEFLPDEYVLLESRTITFDYDVSEIMNKSKLGKIQTMEKQKTKLLADVDAIDEQIKSMLAIENKGANNG